MITEYTEICILCGKPKEDTHHLLNGNNRATCDEDNITIPLCRKCHTEIHKNATCEKLCKIIGQLAWESNYYAEGRKDARKQFLKRYRKSYI